MKMYIIILSLLLAVTGPLYCADAPDVNDSSDDGSIVTTTDPPADSDGAVSREDAIEQARNSIAEPGAVRDLTDPGTVYTQLSEGVSAWIASLGGNRDQFGNEITSSYVTATRPDVVPASLQTFLLGFYKDNPQIGLAFGPAGVQEATTRLHDQYNEAVSNMADDIMAAGDSESDNNSQNPEDVPNLDDDSDNGTGDGNNTDSDGNSDDNSDSSGDDNNDDSSDTTAPGASGIEEKYGVILQAGDKDFTDGEVKIIDEALAALPSDFYSPRQVNNTSEDNPIPTRIQRHASIVYDGDQCFGLYNKVPPAHIEISDIAADKADFDFAVPPFTEEESKEAQFGGTLVHEMLHRYVSVDESGNYVADIIDKPFLHEWATQFGWSSSGGSWSVADKSTCVTDYAANVNPEEDMAESVMMYVYWPNKLKAINQGKYDFIKNQLGIRETNKDYSYPP